MAIPFNVWQHNMGGTYAHMKHGWQSSQSIMGDSNGQCWLMSSNHVGIVLADHEMLPNHGGAWLADVIQSHGESAGRCHPVTWGECWPMSSSHMGRVLADVIQSYGESAG